MITYAAINLTNKKFYVGSTTDFNSRCKKHLSNKGDLAFHRSLRKNPENFYWIVSEDDGLDTRDEEQYYLNFYHGTLTCYNLRPSAEQGGDTCSNTQWWNNGIETVRSLQSPGENWVQGRLDVPVNFTAFWWNDGVTCVRSINSPGKGWTRGHLFGRNQSGVNNGNYGKKHPGTYWWNNGEKSVRVMESPGEGWVRGRIKRNN